MEIIGEPPELEFTLTITRKETGQVETFNLVGHITSIEETIEEEI